VSITIVGSLSQAMANEPGVAWGKGRFTPQYAKLLVLLPGRLPVGLIQGRCRPASTCGATSARAEDLRVDEILRTTAPRGYEPVVAVVDPRSIRAVAPASSRAGLHR